MNQVEDSSSQKMYVYHVLHMNEFMLIYFKSLSSRYWYDDTYMCCLPSVLTVRVSDPPYLEFPETSLQFVFSVHCICCICFVVASWVNLKTTIFPLVNSSSKRWCDLWYDLKRPKEDKWHFPVFLRSYESRSNPWQRQNVEVAAWKHMAGTPSPALLQCERCTCENSEEWNRELWSESWHNSGHRTPHSTIYYSQWAALLSHQYFWSSEAVWWKKRAEIQRRGILQHCSCSDKCLTWKTVIMKHKNVVNCSFLPATESGNHQRTKQRWSCRRSNQLDSGRPPPSPSSPPLQLIFWSV